MADILFNERLDDHLFALQDAASPSEAAVLLRAFNVAMGEHFEAEERSDGLFATLITRGAPADEVARLRMEHDEVRRDVDTLGSDARCGVDVSPMLASLVRRMRDHEQREAELVRRTLAR